MMKSKHFLIAGGMISTLISIMHVLLVLKPALFVYISAGQESMLAQLAVQGSSPTTIATIALALIFAVWAIYAFSGAGLIRPLPLLRAALILISVIYLFRALAIFTEINMVMNQGYPFRFVVFSAISLIAGLFYLFGVLIQRSDSTQS
ncbi:MAG TPA: hypothetical protein VI451_12190 [Anaerolineales bacterium]|nr:hypothetical protein [Anaerolineales bacterium]